MNYNLIQLAQVNNPQFSGYILNVVSPFTGSSPLLPSGNNGQFQFKSGNYFAGSELTSISGKIGFGTSSPRYDFHISGKTLRVDGTGDFSTLTIDGIRVITIDELNASGQYLQISFNALSGLVSSFGSTGYIGTNYYPRNNPSGYISTGQTGNFLATGSSQIITGKGLYITGSMTFPSTGQNNYSGFLAPDFAGPVNTKYSITGNITISGFQNMQDGRAQTIRISGYSGANRTITTAPFVHYVGTVPTGISVNKIMLISYTCFGTGVSDIVGSALSEL